MKGLKALNFTYKTKGVCSRSINIELDGDTVVSARFEGGCNGNTKGISSLVVGIIGICLCGISYGFSPTVSAAFIASFYGMKYYPTNLSIINLVLIPASFMSTIAGSIGDYTVIFSVLLACSVVGLLINITIKKP